MPDEEESPSTWLEPDDVTDVIGSDLAEGLESEDLRPYCNAARAYVEPKRTDLVLVVDEDLPAAFIPTADVLLGAALLAYRWYQRRTATDEPNPGSVPDDPDIRRLLGIGSFGRVVFGAPAAPVEVV